MEFLLRSVCFQLLLLTYFCLINNVGTIYTCPAKCSVMTVIVDQANNATSSRDEKFAYRREKCRFYSETVQCVNRSLDFTVRGRLSAEHSAGKVSEDDFLTLPPCDPEDAHVTLSPYLDQSSRKIGQPPIVRLNVTVRILDSRAIHAVAIRMTCLENGPGLQGQEFLCNDQSRPGWDRFYWPCRMFDWSKMTFDPNGTTKQPIGLTKSQTFTHDCFRAGATLALMRAHVVLYPKACLLNYAYRIPPLNVISGSDSSFDVENWVPFLYVDSAAGQNGSVTVHYTLPPVHKNSKVKALIIELIDQGPYHPDQNSLDQDRFTIRTEAVYLSEESRTSLTFHDLPPGRYLAVVRVQADWCSVDSTTTDRPACSFTYVPFNLTNRNGQQHSRLFPSKFPPSTNFGKMPASFKLAIALVGGLFFASCAIFSFYGAKLWQWRQNFRRRSDHRHRSTSLTAIASNRSKTDVIYLPPKMTVTEE